MSVDNEVVSKAQAIRIRKAAGSHRNKQSDCLCTRKLLSKMFRISDSLEHSHAHNMSGAL